MGDCEHCETHKLYFKTDEKGQTLVGAVTRMELHLVTWLPSSYSCVVEEV